HDGAAVAVAVGLGAMESLSPRCAHQPIRHAPRPPAQANTVLPFTAAGLAGGAANMGLGGVWQPPGLTRGADRLEPPILLALDDRHQWGTGSGADALPVPARKPELDLP